jgi:hypothetical protein
MATLCVCTSPNDCPEGSGCEDCPPERRFATIQAAVDAARQGDRILVCPGSYGPGQKEVFEEARAKGLEVVVYVHSQGAEGDRP